MTREDILADVIRKNLLGVAPDSQEIDLDDDDYRLILELLETRKGHAVTEPFVARYRNWRGEVSERRLIPLEVWFGSTEWHPEPQWLLRAFDLDKQADRDFALADFHPPTSDDIADQEFGRRYAEAYARRDFEHIARVLSVRLYEMDKRACRSNRRADAAEKALRNAVARQEADDASDPMTSLRSAIAGLEQVGVDTSELAGPNVVAVWPIGCIKRSACARHKACVYGNFGSCTHATRSIAEEVQKASEGGR